MKPKISISKKTHRTIWIIATVITVFVVLIGLFFLTGRTIDEKTQNSITVVSDINNSLNKLSRQDSATSTLDYTKITAENTLTLISNAIYIKPNVFETIYHNNKSDNLNNINSETEKTNITTAEVLSNTIETISLLSKYLNYSASEDFIALGEDPANDETRINLAVQAIGNLAKDDNLPQEIKNELNESIATFEAFSNDKNIEVLDSTITNNQKDIVIIIDGSVSKIVKDYNTFYNTLLYQ